MKYIITDDLNKLVFNNDVDIEQYDNIKGHILKQANTIEELCDGFYVDKCKEEFLYDEIFEECLNAFALYFKNCAKNGIDVYGFIKTDNGLIYIAKMNEDGILELIKGMIQHA